MSANNRISNLVAGQLPFFVRNDHQLFVKFLEYYYEYLEQENKLVHTAKTLRDKFDPDRTSGEFEQKLYEQFLRLIPNNVVADKTLILKHVKDFYRSRGSEKSIRFLLNVLYGNAEEVSFYYPKDDILRASDGKWFIEKSLKVSDIRIDGSSNTSIVGVKNFANTTIVGNTSGATAIVESVDVYYEKGVLVDELKITGITKTFSDGEEVFALFTENGMTKSITANIFGGEIVDVSITNPGTLYEVGDEVIVESNTGSGASIIVSRVSSGNVISIGPIYTGAGFQANDFLLITGGGGSGANAKVLTVNTDETYHPNTYNIAISQIYLESNTAIGNAVYSNLNPAVSDPANDWVSNSMSYFVYANTGPVATIFVISGGTGYETSPTFDIKANTRIRSLGILGRMDIVDGGTGYAANDKIEFLNRSGTYGWGAWGNVSAVNGTGSITSVEFIQLGDAVIGGSGYEQTKLPIANVISGTGSGANVQVKTILGDGEILAATTAEIGAIQRLRILDGGSGYRTPTLNLTQSGDGTATATAEAIRGVFTYPGRYLNDDGHLSGYNFLQDRDYYQVFSYVIRTNKSINDYRKAILELTHPAGTKLWGEFLHDDAATPVNSGFQGTSTSKYKFILSTYQANLGTILINTTDHGLNTNSTVHLEFVSGDTINISNGQFIVTTANANTFWVLHSNTTNTTGSVYAGIAV